MPNFTDISGLAGVASAMTAALLLLPGITRLDTLRCRMLLSLAFILVLIPFGELPLAAYVRGVTGDLSITTLVLLWSALLNTARPFPLEMPKDRGNGLLILVALTGVVFYPPSLGVGMLDPYRYGFGSAMFIVALLLIALTAWMRKSGLIVLCIALSTLAWSLGWYESSNLWDYLLDPFLVIYALWRIAMRMGNQSPSRRTKS